MAKENEIVIYTDFDKTMIRDNTPIYFSMISSMFHPSISIRLIKAFRKFGKTGKGFLSAISQLNEKNRKRISAITSRIASLKPTWLAELTLLVKKYPNIKNIKLIIITRNIELIPELFMQRKKIIARIQAATRNRFKADYIIIGNKSLQQGIQFSSSKGEVNIRDIISISSDKIRFIRKKNAFFIGDTEEYEQLSKHPKLRNLHFIRV